LAIARQKPGFFRLVERLRAGAESEPSPMFQVFVSSTYSDLKEYRAVVRDVVLDQKWHPVMMEHFGSQLGHSVEVCRRQVRKCDLLLLLVAHARGSAPLIEKGGNGRDSYTAFELDEAERCGIPVRVLLADDDWPMRLCESDAEARAWVAGFRRRIERVAQKFAREETPDRPVFRNLVRQALLDHRDELRRGIDAGLRSEDAGFRQTPTVRAVLSRLAPIVVDVVVDRELVRRAYVEAHPLSRDDLPHVGDSPSLMTAAIRRLSVLPTRASDSSHPLLSFLAAIGDVADVGDRADVRDAIEKVAEILGCAQPSTVPPTMRPLAPPTATPPSAAPSGNVIPCAATPAACHVVARFDADTMSGGGGHLCEAWLYEEGRPELVHVAREPWTERNRREMLQALVRDVHERVGFERDVVFEFAVSRSLIDQAIDQWEMFDTDVWQVGGAQPTLRLGIEYPIVMRILERQRLPAARPKHVDRWARIRSEAERPCQLLSAAGVPAPPHPIALLVDDHRRDGAVYSRFSSHASATCAVLDREPSLGDKEAGMDVVHQLLRAGVPVIVWPRRKASKKSHDELIDELRGFLERGPLKRLPWLAREHRRDDARSPLTSRRLTVVWDDADRPVPERGTDQHRGIEIRS